MADSSLWKDMQINDMLVIDTIRKDGKDTIYFKDKDSRFIWNNTMHAKQFGSSERPTGTSSRLNLRTRQDSSSWRS